MTENTRDIDKTDKITGIASFINKCNNIIAYVTKI